MNSRDRTLSIEINNNLVHEITQNLRDLPGNPMEAEKFTIFRVPAHIRQKKKELYKPRMISIGPYYNGNVAFQAMEKYKWRYLRDYLSRNTRNSLEHCVSELRRLESRARSCYFEEVKLQSDRFLMMLLLDGCFIIEFMIKWNSGVSDTIFDVGWVLPIIRSDLLLLENQIPFFVIQKLFGLLTSFDFVTAKENTSASTPVVPIIAPLVEMLLVYLSEGKKAGHQVLVLVEIKHILHLYHLCYVSPLRPNNLSKRTYGIHRWLNPIKLVFVFLTSFLKLCFRRTKSSNRKFPRTIPSATELEEAGIIFKCKKSENILDIKFQNGTLEIPFFSIEETRRSRLSNLVSFEQCYSQLDKDLTSYARFMGFLFKTPRDVALLQKKGIIDNLLPTNEELVTFFSWLTECSYLDFDAHYLKELFKDVNMYYSSDWHRWRATLKRNYFSNPWSIISFIAAFALLVLAFLQTLYTIFPYYHPRKN
ncbi:UPF0481 protein At3g47200-like [Carex rostrata]